MTLSREKLAYRTKNRSFYGSRTVRRYGSQMTEQYAGVLLLFSLLLSFLLLLLLV